jgi:hypothetical protein
MSDTNSSIRRLAAHLARASDAQIQSASGTLSDEATREAERAAAAASSAASAALAAHTGNHSNPHAVTAAQAGAEAALGNPGTTGYVLSSTTGGVRSWVAQSGGVTWTLRKDTSQGGIAPATFTKLAWDTAVSDPRGVTSVAADTVTPLAGTYEYEVNVLWLNPMEDLKVYAFVLYKNGVLFKDGAMGPMSGTGYMAQRASFIVSASGSDVFSVYVYHEATVNQTVFGATSSLRTFWSGYRLGD